jgi:hypothetical protein
MQKDDNKEQNNSPDRLCMPGPMQERALFVEQMLPAMEQELLKILRPAITDYIRLVELQERLVDEGPTVVKVEWIETLDEKKNGG